MLGNIFKFILLGIIGFCSLPFITMNLKKEKEQCEKKVINICSKFKGKSKIYNNCIIKEKKKSTKSCQKAFTRWENKTKSRAVSSKKIKLKKGMVFNNQCSKTVFNKWIVKHCRPYLKNNKKLNPCMNKHKSLLNNDCRKGLNDHLNR